jgi:hypothetical protein
MLAAFQKSIESLTSRLEHETNQNELKEQELERLRAHSAVGTSPGNGKVHTLQRHNTYNGSFSDFSDIDNENPSHFDRKKKTRKSWKVCGLQGDQSFHLYTSPDIFLLMVRVRFAVRNGVNC